MSIIISFLIVILVIFLVQVALGSMYWIVEIIATIWTELEDLFCNKQP